MTRLLVLVVTVILVFSFTTVHDAKAASITGVDISFSGCPPTSFSAVLYGSFNEDDIGDAGDLFRFRILDAGGSVLFSLLTHVPNGSNSYELRRIEGNIPINGTLEYPYTILVNEVNSDREVTGVLFSDQVNPCRSGRTTLGTRPEVIRNPVIVAEEARGITRVFDDGVVIARQPDNSYEYYLPDGCFIARTDAAVFDNANLPLRYVMGSYEACEGYRVDLWSLGYPACQFQINMYGPNGYEKVYEFPRLTDDPRCVSPSATSATVTFGVPLSDGSTFLLNYDVSSGAILNGSDFVISELQRIDRMLNGLAYSQQLRLFFNYANPTTGETERIRGDLEAVLCANGSSCIEALHYQIGDEEMDLSGLGNIAYGYIAARLGFDLRFQTALASGDQFFRNLFGGLGVTFEDNPDDIQQRQVGYYLYQRGISEENLEQAAQEFGLD